MTRQQILLPCLVSPEKRPSQQGTLPKCYLLLLLLACIVQIMRDPETGNSKGFGFVSYSSFEGSDAAIEVGCAIPFCSSRLLPLLLLLLHAWFLMS